MAKHSIEIQDDAGNIYYPHGEAKTTFLEDGKDIEEKLKELTPLIQSWGEFKANGGEIGGTLTFEKGVRQSQQIINMRDKDYLQRAGLSNYNGYPCWATIIEDPNDDNNTNGLLFMLGSGVEDDNYRDNYVRPLKMGYAQKNYLGSSSVPWDDIHLRGVSKAKNGHTKVSNGMIMQWGYGSLNGKITFPIKFPSETLSVVASADNTQAAYTSCKDVTTTSFVTVASQNGGFRWIAIGY